MPGALTDGCVVFVLVPADADGLPDDGPAAEAVPDGEAVPVGAALPFAAPPLAAGAATIARNVAAPADVPAARAAAEAPAVGGSAIMVMPPAAVPAASGGQDLAMDPTSALWPPWTATRAGAGWVTRPIRNTASSASSTAPGRAMRRIRTHRSRRCACQLRASGLAARAWPHGASAAPAWMTARRVAMDRTRCLARAGRPGSRGCRARQARRRRPATRAHV